MISLVKTLMRRLKHLNLFWSPIIVCGRCGSFVYKTSFLECPHCKFPGYFKVGAIFVDKKDLRSSIKRDINNHYKGWD